MLSTNDIVFFILSIRLALFYVFSRWWRFTKECVPSQKQRLVIACDATDSDYRRYLHDCKIIHRGIKVKSWFPNNLIKIRVTTCDFVTICVFVTRMLTCEPSQRPSIIRQCWRASISTATFHRNCSQRAWPWRTGSRKANYSGSDLYRVWTVRFFPSSQRIRVHVWLDSEWSILFLVAKSGLIHYG